MMRLSFILSFAFLTTSLAAPAPASTASPTATAPVAVSTICGDIVSSGEIIFAAKDAYNCLTSVPFNPAVATRFLKYYTDTLEFQTTLAYLKNPPASYQQPASDLFKDLKQLQQDIDKGAFPNQYAFEATLQSLIYSAHDSHLNLVAGILSAFTFASPYGIASVSIDGIQLPKVYLTDDLVDSQANGASWKPSAISKINGHEVTDYLSQFAAWNAVGSLEPHADWNQLMSSSALDIQNLFSIFEGYTTFYPGDELTFTFENGTELGPEPWLAIYNSPGETGPLATGGDFYNFFVLGLYPASYNPDAVATDSSAAPTAAPTQTADSAANVSSTASVESIAPTPTAWESTAYPQKPDIVQDDFTISGVLSGYFLHDISTAVLSIPSFQAFDNAVEAFSKTIGDFLAESKKAGMKKILIDVQQNGGGVSLLAIDAFKQFFPSIDPFAGSRLRAHSAADVLGTTYTDYYNSPTFNESYYDWFSVSNWVASVYLNAETGRNFTSWGEFFGPHEYNGDYFTTTQRYNLSSVIFDAVASGGIVVHGYAGVSTPPQPYAAEDIVILTDALCSSACAEFMELMHHEGGVRTVVAGGRPKTGPMQAPSGSRGAQFYSSVDLDTDFAVAGVLNSTALEVLPPRSEDVFVQYAGINLRDQIRKGENTPLQFLYEAADCRIFYTPETFNNYTKLWKYAADAIWTRPELCVKDSTGYASTGPSSDTAPAPPASQPVLPANVSRNLFDTIHLATPNSDLPPALGGQVLDVVRESVPSIGQLCGASSPNKADCGSRGLACKPVDQCGRKASICVLPCSSFHDPCGGFKCIITSRAPSTYQGHSKSVSSGFCSVQCNSRSGPDFPTADSPPLSPSFSSGKGGSSSRGSYLKGETYGNYIKAGMAPWP